jgi:hypothetical protein
MTFGFHYKLQKNAEQVMAISIHYSDNVARENLSLKYS